MSKNNKKLAKKKTHEREARKRVLERRKAIRQERKDELMRERAFEKEFSQKQNLGLTTEEIKQKLEHNMKILEALENELVQEEETRKKNTSAFMEKAVEDMAKFEELVAKKEDSQETAEESK
jgi:hypothetical protein